MASGYWSPIAIGTGDGPTLTAAAAASMVPVTAKFTFPPNGIQVGSALRIRAQGRISCVVTTPGTARFDVRLGGTVCFDSGAMSLNIIAKTTLPWWLEIDMICRAIGSGTSANFFGFSRWTSEAYINTAIATTGPAPGAAMSASASGVDSAPAVGGGFDSTVANTLDVFFTQTAATGSFTCHNLIIETGAIALT